MDSGATGIDSAVITAHLPGRRRQPASLSGQEDDQSFAAVGADWPAAQRAGLVSNRREPGDRFKVGEALVTQPVLGRGGDERGAAPGARPGGADQVHCFVSFRISGAGGAPGFLPRGTPRVLMLLRRLRGSATWPGA